MTHAGTSGGRRQDDDRVSSVLISVCADNPVMLDVLNGEVDKVRLALRNDSPDAFAQLLERIGAAQFDGACNLLHACSSLANDALQPDLRGGGADAVAAFDASTASVASPGGLERFQTHVDILRALVDTLSSSGVPLLKRLLCEQDAAGLTPFTYALSLRVYDAAQCLLEASERLQLGIESVFPLGSCSDNSPLLMLCRNDACSFKWTGSAHVSQNVYECKTCGLTQPLCCCTACAWSCHRFHDCKLKVSAMVVLNEYATPLH